jgi:hypothetical protein
MKLSIRLMTTMLIMVAAPAIARDLGCAVEASFDCTREKCTKSDDGPDAHANYGYHSARKMVEVCLGESCMKGAMSARRAKDTNEVVLFGFLYGEKGHPAANVPLALALTISEKTGEFTAIWPIGSYGTTVQYGHCN